MANIRPMTPIDELPSSRLMIAVRHLRQNTEFGEVVKHIREEHAKYWRQFLRDPNIHMYEMARGKAAAYAELYKLLTGEELVD